MNITKIIKNNFLALVALATVIGFSAFKMADKSEGKPLAPVMVYFHGNPTIAAEVANPENWRDTPTGQSCAGNNLACSMEVDSDDLTSSGTLDPSRIELSAIETSSGYRPEKIGGESPTNPQIFNRD